MKFQNVTNKEGFLKAVEGGLFEIKTIKIEDSGKIEYEISDNRFNKVTWILHKFENNYAIEYKGIDPFNVYCTMNGDNIQIEHAVLNGKNYKAEKYLKKFTHVCMFANCFINFGLCD